MRAIDVIIKKRDGKALTKEEIDFFVAGFAQGEIPDYQASAWAMAVLLQGMSHRETTDLTLAMAASGEQLDLASVAPLSVDKHSTGGVGDKTTLVVQPIVAACGVPVSKMSGHGLGFSGGTLDKIESIPGYRSELTTEEFLHQLKTVGLVLSGQTSDLAPADGKLYALRDVTGTIASIPLIASSVMSKKITGGAEAMVLDVKVGLGAFMQTHEEAEELASCMVEIGRRAGRRVVALISDMNQPLGYAVGNALEVSEAIDTLRDGGPEDFRDHCLEVAGHMLVLAGKANALRIAKQLAADQLSNRAALGKFCELVLAQGGDVRYVDEPERLPKADRMLTATSPASGYLAQVHAREIGLTAVDLGAGRAQKGDSIDHAVGIVVHHKVGDQLNEGDPLFTIHANDEDLMNAAAQRVMDAHQIVDETVEPLPLFYKTIGASKS